MKKSSLLLPTILILSLVALGLIIFRVFSTGEETITRSQGSGSNLNNQNFTATDSQTVFDPRSTPAPLREDKLADLVPADGPGPHDADTHDGGRYLVIAGTFRQMINARTRLRNLHEAGFERTQLESFDRGTYAVALVDRTSSYGNADSIARQLREAGFEAQIYTKP